MTNLGNLEIAESDGNANWRDVVLTLEGGLRITLEDLIKRFGEKAARITELEHERDEALQRIAGLEQAYDNAVTRRFKARVSLAGCVRERDEARRQYQDLVDALCSKSWAPRNDHDSVVKLAIRLKDSQSLIGPMKKSEIAKEK